ncbi:unnamed protein product [Chrysoparadoxa australica]
MRPFILMCGSEHIEVQKHATLVLGNMAQGEEHRGLVGLEGGIEALLVLCEGENKAVMANALWALGALAWNPHNQERIGRYLPQLMSYVSDSAPQVKANALVCVANSLYYHKTNRTRVAQIPGAIETLIGFCAERDNCTAQEASLRALLSLTYFDPIAIIVGKSGGIPALMKVLRSEWSASPSHTFTCFMMSTAHIGQSG